MSGSATPRTQNDMTTCLDTFKKGWVLQLTPSTLPRQRKARDSRRDMLEHQNEHFVRDVLKLSHVPGPKYRRFRTSFLVGLYLKINVSREASIRFHHMSQNATPATEFARCRRFAQHCQYDSQKKRNTTRLKCCACHTK